MDFGEVLTRTWQITWRYKGLWYSACSPAVERVEAEAEAAPVGRAPQIPVSSARL